jgi:hypothetical protein
VFALWRSGNVHVSRETFLSDSARTVSAGGFLSDSGRTVSADGMFEFTLVCSVALQGHESLDVATSLKNVGSLPWGHGEYEEALVQHHNSLDIKIRVVGATIRMKWRPREPGDDDDDDDDAFLFVLAETNLKSAQRYVPQGYFPPYEAV